MRSSEESQKLSNWNEDQLVSGIAAGQPEARAAFVAASHDAVFSFACRLAPMEDLRRDWTHDCLLRIISDIETGAFELRHAGGFWSWFRKRSWFLLLESRRSYVLRNDRETLAGDSLPDLPGTSSPQHDLERSEIIDAVHKCIDGIDHQGHRDALRLLLLCDYSYQETATTMDSPLNTVRSWIRLGRLALRQCLRRTLGISTGENES